MKSDKPGSTTSEVEVTSVSRHGLWLYVAGREFFLAFSEYPWFESAPLKDVLHVELPQPDHLWWPELDVDLHVDSLEHPERYPLRAAVPAQPKSPG